MFILIVFWVNALYSLVYGLNIKKCSYFSHFYSLYRFLLMLVNIISKSLMYHCNASVSVILSRLHCFGFPCFLIQKMFVWFLLFYIKMVCFFLLTVSCTLHSNHGGLLRDYWTNSMFFCFAWSCYDCLRI